MILWQPMQRCTFGTPETLRALGIAVAVHARYFICTCMDFMAEIYRLFRGSAKILVCNQIADTEGDYEYGKDNKIYYKVLSYNLSILYSRCSVFMKNSLDTLAIQPLQSKRIRPCQCSVHQEHACKINFGQDSNKTGQRTLLDRTDKLVWCRKSSVDSVYNKKESLVKTDRSVNYYKIYNPNGFEYYPNSTMLSSG